MTRLLVSVRDVAEARMALAGGVDLIDLKEPNAGALGAVSVEIVHEILAIVGGRLPLSAALGELLEGAERAAAELPIGIAYAKVGLAGCARHGDWPRRLRAALTLLPRSVTPVAVVYADEQFAEAPSAEQVLAHAARLGCQLVLVDTFHKTGGDLLGHWTMIQLQRFVQEARRLGLRIVLGGSLGASAIRRVWTLQPDYVAVRGAVCAGDRRATVDAARLAQIVALVADLGATKTPAQIC